MGKAQGSGGVGETLYALQFDTAAGGVSYVGEAPPGSATSTAMWRIKRLTETAGPDIVVTWADGNAYFDNIWNDRATLSYS